MAGRKNGSIAIALISGVALALLGIVTLWSKRLFGMMDLPHALQWGERLIDGIASLLFAAVLIIWAFSYEKAVKPKPRIRESSADSFIQIVAGG